MSDNTRKQKSKRNDKSSKATSSKGQETKKTKSKWKRLLEKLKRKKQATNAAPRVAAESSPNVSVSSPSSSKSVTESLLGDVFVKWSTQRNAANSRQAALFLQKQVEQYETEVERKRQKLLSETRTFVFAVTGGKYVNELKSTDDRLPYEQKPMNWAQIMEQLKKPHPVTEPVLEEVGSVESSQAAEVSSTSAPSEEIPSSTSSTAEEVPTAEAAEDSAYGPTPVAETTTASVAPVESSYEMQSSVTEKSESDSSSRTSTSSSEKLPGEESGHLTNILMSIIADANKSQTTVDMERSMKQLSPPELAALSRNEEEKFEKLITDNTKEGLFDAQPTPEEIDNWNRRNARPHHGKAIHEIKINDSNVERRVYCLTCFPRHPNYPFAKYAHR